MVENKPEGNEEQGQLMEIEKIVRSIDGKVSRIESGMRGERVLQLGFTMLTFMFAILFAFIIATLTSDVGKEIYGRWVNHIIGFIGALGIGLIGFFWWLYLNAGRKTGKKLS